MSALQEQLAYLEASSPFYAERLRGVREDIHGPDDLPKLPFTTKDELRAGQLAEPPFGPHLCAPRERLVRMHVTSGTTGEPVAVGFTRADHEANSAVGGEAFRIAGVRPDDVIAHCLNDMTFHGFSEAEVREFRDELDRRVAEIDEMSEEQKARTLIPAEKVFSKLKDKFDRKD